MIPCIHYPAFSSPLVIAQVLPPAILAHHERLHFVIRPFTVPRARNGSCAIRDPSFSGAGWKRGENAESIR